METPKHFAKFVVFYFRATIFRLVPFICGPVLYRSYYLSRISSCKLDLDEEFSPGFGTIFLFSNCAERSNSLMHIVCTSLIPKVGAHPTMGRLDFKGKIVRISVYEVYLVTGKNVSRM